MMNKVEKSSIKELKKKLEDQFMGKDSMSTINQSFDRTKNSLRKKLDEMNLKFTDWQ